MGSPPPTEHSRKTTRRGALGALAAGLGGLVVGGRRAAARTTEIATVAGQGRVLETATVPAAWYERERHARAVLRAVRERYAGVAGVLDVTLGTAGDPVADVPTSSIDLHVDSTAGVDAAVPSTFDGVRSRLVDTAEPEPLATGERSRESIGGATTVRTEAGATASATCGVTWRGERYLMTCAHLFKGSDGHCEAIRGMGVYAASGERIGRVVATDSVQDWALVDCESPAADLDRTIRGVSGDLCGRVTADGLQYLKCNRTAVFKKGQATPERSGWIRALGVRHGGCDIRDGANGNHYVDVDVPAQPGDSGGPVYHRFEYNGREYLALVGAVSASVQYTRASAAYAIHDAHGIEFSSSIPSPG